jgi:hypothetical protein
MISRQPEAAYATYSNAVKSRKSKNHQGSRTAPQCLAARRLRGERNGPCSGECLRQPRQHHKVSMERHALKPSHSKRCESVAVLQAAKLSPRLRVPGTGRASGESRVGSALSKEGLAFRLAKPSHESRLDIITRRRILYWLAAMVVVLVVGTIIGLIWADTSDVAGFIAVVTNIVGAVGIVFLLIALAVVTRRQRQAT